jgi:hypothetical protein
MKTAIGGLGWRPADFWQATVTEYFAGVNGHNEANSPGEASESPPNKDEMSELVARYGNNG